MFKSNGKEIPTKNGVQNAQSINIIGKGTGIEGQVISEGDVRIDGKVEGTVITKSKLVIGNSGYVNGDVSCQSADVSGHVVGKLKVKEVLYLKATAIVEGSVSTEKIVIESGAKFNGDCKMNITSTEPVNGIKQPQGANSKKETV